jgi:hypothetical protein
MSAALAIAVERQVDAIIAAAKAKCRLHAHLAYIAERARASGEGPRGVSTFRA